MTSATHLYRHFDAAGQLLYVGISLNAIKRLDQHRAQARWFDRIARVEIEQFPTWEEAAAAEVKAIAEERPECNVKDNPQAPPPKAKPKPEPLDQSIGVEDLDLKTPNGRKILANYNALIARFGGKASVSDQIKTRKKAERQVIADNLRNEYLASPKPGGALFDRWRSAERMASEW
jgi:hypothetical protein